MNLLDPYNFYFELPLYTPVKIEKDNGNEEAPDPFWDLLHFTGRLNAYNPSLKENTTFQAIQVNRGSYYSQGGLTQFILSCLRTEERYTIYALYDSTKEIFQKIGQYPSIADIHISKIKEYDAVLSKEKLKEFTRAIGLAANGVGIGSFVYLRRIFESLIHDAHEVAKTISGWEDEKYNSSRMPEKIELLTGQLPSFLVENRSLYGILSKGIHQLTEDECLAYFETVKVGIELILDEKVDKYKKAKKLEDAKKKISEVTEKMNR